MGDLIVLIGNCQLYPQVTLQLEADYIKDLLLQDLRKRPVYFKLLEVPQAFGASKSLSSLKE